MIAHNDPAIPSLEGMIAHSDPAIPSLEGMIAHNDPASIQCLMGLSLGDYKGLEITVLHKSLHVTV